MTEVTCVLDAKAGLGECPVWSAEERALYWVDSIAPAMHRLDPATGATRSWPMPKPIGSFALRENGGAVVALRDGFYTFDLVTGLLRFLAGPPPVPGTRFNDGKASPDGRFFAGTMDAELLSRPLGALYRLDPDHSIHQVVDGLLVSNGLGWSADGKTMFHSDSKAKTIWAYDYRDGEVSGRRVVASPDEATGRPDGAAVDVEGYYWSAGISAGVLNRWSPGGRLDRVIPLPCSNPTMPCFGGGDLTTIYVTSLRHDVPADVLAAKPLSGGIFALDAGVAGVPVARYKG
jgi:sugar lactone lactonase YvrE